MIPVVVVVDIVVVVVVNIVGVNKSYSEDVKKHQGCQSVDKGGGI